MANPRQRSKARSGKSLKPSLAVKRRTHKRLRKTPALKGPEVLQQGWDNKKTVFQNYAALGLLPSIPLPTTASGSRSHRAKLRVPNASPTDEKDRAPGLVVGYGRIVRDDKGRVVDIILPEDEKELGVEGRMDVDDEEEEGEERKVEGKTDIVRSLESLASTSKPVSRHSSTSERTWLLQLVDKYGDDTGAMARDRGLNVWQKTEGEIRRMVRKAGGAGKLVAAGN